MTWRSAGVLALALVAARYMREAAPAQRRVIWLVASGAVALVTATTLWATMARAMEGPQVIRETLVNAGPRVVRIAEQLPPPAEAAPWQWGIAGLWVAGSFAALVSWARSVLRHRRRLRRASASSWPACLPSNLRIPARLPVMTTPDLRTAAIVGVFRPRLLLGTDAPRWPVHTLSHVVAHEVAHFASGDHLAGGMARLLSRLQWWNPCMRFMAERLAAEQEFAADAAAAYSSDRPGYAETLLTLARRSSDPVTDAHLAMDGAPVAERIAALLQAPVTVTARVGLALVLLVAATAAIAAIPWRPAALGKPAVNETRVPVTPRGTNRIAIGRDASGNIEARVVPSPQSH